MGFSRQEYWSDCHLLFQEIFPTKGSNPCLLCLLHCKQILYLLRHLGSPMLVWPGNNYLTSPCLIAPICEMSHCANWMLDLTYYTVVSWVPAVRWWVHRPGPCGVYPARRALTALWTPWAWRRPASRSDLGTPRAVNQELLLEALMSSLRKATARGAGGCHLWVLL